MNGIMTIDPHYFCSSWASCCSLLLCQLAAHHWFWIQKWTVSGI